MTRGTSLGGKFAARAFLFALALVLGQSELRAEGVTIESDNPSQRIKLQVDKATVGEVLQALHDKYGVVVAGNTDIDSDDPISVTFQGSLPDILARLLRNQNYMIVRSKRNVTGVEKILIAVSDHSKDTKSPPPPAASPAMP
ncbi:hypothetical protein RLW55_10400 [Hyphomicrobium sp. B1]|uniref:hypothetical protein n=1 Tax=unclassified Hyphomicrobium TaxID=2619925 RepID=UPI0039C16267